MEKTVTEKKYQIDTAENKAWMKECRDSLFSFGKRFPSPEGGAYYLGDDGTPWTDRPRETWITCRMAHVYSMASLLGIDGAEALADAALRGLAGELKDTEHGGWFAGRTADGEILPRKQCYAHAFVILAATSALLAKRPGARALLTEALEIFDRYFWEEAEGMTVDAWDTDFTTCDPYRGVNANMHTVEAFLAVADATGDLTYRARAGCIIKRVIDFAKVNDWRIPEHYREDWTPDLDCHKDRPDDPFQPYGATPGHGIEWARLIVQWAAATRADRLQSGDASRIEETGSIFGWNDPEIKEYVSAAESLYQRAVNDGWNADGERGFVYTTDWNGKPVVHDRMHWVLAEALNTAAVLWRLTGEECYAKDYEIFCEYLDEVVLDHVNGSWFHQLDEKNRLLGTVWPGKSDLYHAVQATLIPYNEKVGKSIAATIRDDLA